MLEKYVAQKFQSETSLEISRDLLYTHKKRRTIRQFSQVAPPREVIENAISVAASAPSGANRQPWHFSLIQNPESKKTIRTLAEKEELDFYKLKPNKQWVEDLKHLHTNEIKSFITEAPYLISIFYRHIDREGDGFKKNYYAKESVGIATGMLISALHLSGLSTLTYTPKRMQFLTEFCQRPNDERPFLLLAVGLPKEDVEVPQISKKSLYDILSIWD